MRYTRSVRLEAKNIVCLVGSTSQVFVSASRHSGSVTLGIEVKVWRDKIKDPLSEGLEQLDYPPRAYRGKYWLVIDF